jgi:sporulation protein YlmC with PRC-barrel domain
MLRNLLTSVYGLSLKAKNGDIGSVNDVYFDDNEWKIRYLVTDSSKFLPARRVLVSPASITEIDFERKFIPVSLSKKEIEDSPVVSRGLLPSRETEIELKSYYDWPVYWGSGYLIGAGDFRPNEASMRESKKEIDVKPDLKSSNDVIGVIIKSQKKTIGYVHDYVFDDKKLEIRYLIVCIQSDLPEKKKILLAVDWIQSFDWKNSVFITDLNTESIEDSPEYKPGLQLKRDYETRLYEYYNRPKYWL